MQWIGGQWTGDRQQWTGSILDSFLAGVEIDLFCTERRLLWLARPGVEIDLGREAAVDDKARGSSIARSQRSELAYGLGFHSSRRSIAQGARNQ